MCEQLSRVISSYRRQRSSYHVTGMSALSGFVGVLVILIAVQQGNCSPNNWPPPNQQLNPPMMPQQPQNQPIQPTFLLPNGVPFVPHHALGQAGLPGYPQSPPLGQPGLPGYPQSPPLGQPGLPGYPQSPPLGQPGYLQPPPPPPPPPPQYGMAPPYYPQPVAPPYGVQQQLPFGVQQNQPNYMVPVAESRYPIGLQRIEVAPPLQPVGPTNDMSCPIQRCEDIESCDRNGCAKKRICHVVERVWKVRNPSQFQCPPCHACNLNTGMCEFIPSCQNG